MMSKQTFLHIIQWSIAIAACIFLVWEIATYDDYPALRASMQAMGWTEWIAIGACIVLMPVNMALEAWRWKTLAFAVDPFNMSWKEAQRQVYYSKLAGIITPWRLGESPLNERSQGELNDALWSKVLSMGAVGSATMTAAIVIAGVVALVFNPSIMAKLGDSYLHALAAVALVLTVGFALAPKALKKYAEVAVAMGAPVGKNDDETAQNGVDFIYQLSEAVGIPSKLTDIGIPQEAVPHLAKAAMEVQRLLKNNPREVTEQDAINIYNSLY